MSFKIIKHFKKHDIAGLLPKLHDGLHKGQCGTIAVIGGSLEYTGAPYFSAMTTLKLGGDLAHVFCQKEAGHAIKCYSPDLIVHPLLDDSDALENIKKWLPRFHSVVIGPGLGRDTKVVSLVLQLLELLKNMRKITVIDADGLYAVLLNPSVLRDFENLYLTPNVVEFKRIYTAVSKKDQINDIVEAQLYLGELFPGATFIHKGATDYIFTGDAMCSVDISSSTKRCGGQGDILSGAVALYAFWASKYYKGDVIRKGLLAGYAGSYTTRVLASYAFSLKGRSLTTNDILVNIDNAVKYSPEFDFFQVF